MGLVAVALTLFRVVQIRLAEFFVMIFVLGNALGFANHYLLQRPEWSTNNKAALALLVAMPCVVAVLGGTAWGLWVAKELLEDRPSRRLWLVLIGIAAPQFAIPAVFLLGGPYEPTREAVSYAGIWRKANLLFSVFDNYNRAFDVTCFVLFLALFGGLVWRRWLRLDPRLGIACGIVFAAYLLLPSQMHGGSGIDRRLPVALFLLLIAASAPRFPSRRIAAAIGGAAAVLLIIRLGAIERVWRAADRVYTADLAGIDLLPRFVR